MHITPSSPPPAEVGGILRHPLCMRYTASTFPKHTAHLIYFLFTQLARRRINIPTKAIMNPSGVRAGTFTGGLAISDNEEESS